MLKNTRGKPGISYKDAALVVIGWTCFIAAGLAVVDPHAKLMLMAIARVLP